jgi:hypothetical protein
MFELIVAIEFVLIIVLMVVATIKFNKEKQTKNTETEE